MGSHRCTISTPSRGAALFTYIHLSYLITPQDSSINIKNKYEFSRYRCMRCITPFQVEHCTYVNIVGLTKYVLLLRAYWVNTYHTKTLNLTARLCLTCYTLQVYKQVECSFCMHGIPHTYLYL